MIECVRIRPAIWDYNSQRIPGIKQTQQRQSLEIANTLNCPGKIIYK